MMDYREKRSNYMTEVAQAMLHEDAWPIYQQGYIDADRLRNEDIEINAFCKMIYEYGEYGIDPQVDTSFESIVLFRIMEKLRTEFIDWKFFYMVAYRFLSELGSYDVIIKTAKVYRDKNNFVNCISLAFMSDSTAGIKQITYQLNEDCEYIVVCKNLPGGSFENIFVEVTGNSNQANYMEIYREVYGDGAYGRIARYIPV